MKNFLSTLLPALALLTLGGCAGTSALTSTETDGVYYSSKDKTTYTASAATTAEPTEEAIEATTDEAINPDYNGSGSTARTGSTEYYDEDYGYSTRIRRFHQPYRGTGLGYYDLAYTDPFWYGSNAYYGGAYGPYGSFYDPFYSPYAFGGGSYISMGFGNPWARPWRYGYGGGYGLGYYDGFNNGYYNGLAGYGYGRPSYYYGNGYNRAYTDNRRSNVNVAPRRDRSSQAYTLDQPAAGNNPVMSTRSRGGNVVNGSNDPAISAPAPTTAGRGRGRILESTSPATVSPQPTTEPSQPEVVTGAATTQPRRWRSMEPASTTPSSSGQPQQEVRPARRVMRSEAGEQVARPQRSESYEQPSRSYSQPSRSYDSSPSSSPSNSGGSSSGGGRGRIR